MSHSRSVPDGIDAFDAEVYFFSWLIVASETFAREFSTPFMEIYRLPYVPGLQSYRLLAKNSPSYS